MNETENFENQAPLNTVPAPLLPAVAPQRKTRLIVFIIVGSLLILGGGAFVFANYYLFSPVRIAKKVAANIATVKSFSYSGQVDLEMGTSSSFLPDGVADSLGNKFTFNFNGTSDSLNAGSIQKDLMLRVSKQGNTNPDEVIGVELRTVNSMIYGAFTDLPSGTASFISGLSGGMFNVGSSDNLKNQWLAIDTSASSTSETVPTLGKKNNFEKMLSEEIANIAASQTIQVAKGISSEKIAGVDTYHVKFSVNKEALKQALVKTMVDAIYADPQAQQISQSRASTTEEIDQQLATSMDSFSLNSGELWIGKSDLLPHQAKFSLVFKGDKNRPDEKADILLNFQNFNQPLPVAVPSPVISLDEIKQRMAAMLGGGGGGNTEKQSAAQMTADTDGDGLNLAQELMYGTDPNKADTDGDGYSDGVEVKGGYNPLGAGKLVTSCGDKICDSDKQENYYSCPEDCSAPSNQLTEDQSTDTSIELNK